MAPIELYREQATMRPEHWMQCIIEARPKRNTVTHSEPKSRLLPPDSLNIELHTQRSQLLGITL